MKLYRCKCGARTLTGAIGPTPCQGCRTCHTTLEQTPERHRTPEPHRWVTESLPTDEGPRPVTRCAWCGISKAKAEQMSDIRGGD